MSAESLNSTKVPSSARDQPPHMLHIYVAQSFADWCAAPCQGPTWELAAKKAVPGSPYALLEVGIWRQEKRIALYRFDEEWVDRARQAYFKVCNGMGWECPQYRYFRESKRLFEAGPWPASADENPKELSSWLRGAFAQLFATALGAAPGAAHIALTYAGHGSRADGGLFEGVLNKDDAVALLQEVTGVDAAASQGAAGQAQGAVLASLRSSKRGGLAAGQFAMLNFGGNCEEGRWNMLDAMHPFAEWVMASDLKVGGYELTDEERSSDEIMAKEHLGDTAILKASAEEGLEPHVWAERLVAARKEMWETVWRKPIERQELEQSISAFNTSRFVQFRSSLRSRYGSLPPAERAEFQKKVESFECDVWMGSQLIDNLTHAGGAPAPSLLARTSRRVEPATGMPLQQLFEELRAIYADTRPIVPWEYDSHGLGFNFLGWHNPPCDLVSALGPDAPEPEGGWSAIKQEW